MAADADLSRSYAQLQHDYARIQQHQAQLEEAYEEVLQSNEQLKADGDSLRQTLKEYERLAQLRDEDQKETTALENDVQRLNRALKDSKAESASLRAELRKSHLQIKLKQKSSIGNESGDGRASTVSSASAAVLAARAKVKAQRLAARKQFSASPPPRFMSDEALPATESTALPATDQSELAETIAQLQEQLRSVTDAFDEEHAARLRAEACMLAGRAETDRPASVSAGEGLAEASLADELSMMDPFAASVRDGEPTTNNGGAAATDETVASSTEKERIKLAVPAAFSSDMQSSTQSRASAGAEVYEAAIEELESELAEVQEQLQETMEERQLLFEQLSEQRRATQQETTDRITALQASGPLREALRNLQEERDSLQRRFLRRGKRLMELQRTLQVNGLGHLADEALRRADTRHARLNAALANASPMAAVAEEEEEEEEEEGDGQQRRNGAGSAPSVRASVSGCGKDSEDAVALAQSINSGSFVSARQRAQSMSTMTAEHRRRLSSVSGLQQARKNAVARGPSVAGERHPDGRGAGNGDGPGVRPAQAMATRRDADNVEMIHARSPSAITSSSGPRRLSIVQSRPPGYGSGRGQTTATPPPKPPLPAHLRRHPQNAEPRNGPPVHSLSKEPTPASRERSGSLWQRLGLA